MNIAEKYVKDMEKIDNLLTAHDNDHLYIQEELYKQKESNMNNELVFVVFDIFDENLNGDLRDHLVGICESISEARSQIEKMNLDNFRWLGKTRCKFSKDGIAHMIIIDDFIINDIFI